MGVSRRAVTGGLAALGLVPGIAAAATKISPPAPRLATLADGTQLYFLTAGLGAPVIFVHGSLSDCSYWQDQLPPFAQKYHALAYSRRYDWPNQNPAIKGYSAVTDADDLAGLIAGQGMTSAHIVGHSYGALAALFLAIRHPELVRTLTLAEPPAVSLLAHLPGDQAPQGLAALKDIKLHMLAPMKAAFANKRAAPADKTEAAVRAFIDYVKGAPGTWDAFSDADKAATLKDAREFEVIFAGGELFPELSPDDVAAIKAPVLRLSGGKSYPFLGLIDQALGALLPGSQQIVFPDATHQMWLEQPDKCRDAVFKLVDTHP
jgi:non-heme chloroperoxidase